MPKKNKTNALTLIYRRDAQKMREEQKKVYKAEEELKSKTNQWLWSLELTDPEMRAAQRHLFAGEFELYYSAQNKNLNLFISLLKSRIHSYQKSNDAQSLFKAILLAGQFFTISIHQIDSLFYIETLINSFKNLHLLMPSPPDIRIEIDYLNNTQFFCELFLKICDLLDNNHNFILQNNNMINDFSQIIAFYLKKRSLFLTPDQLNSLKDHHARILAEQSSLQTKDLFEEITLKSSTFTQDQILSFYNFYETILYLEQHGIYGEQLDESYTAQLDIINSDLHKSDIDFSETLNASCHTYAMCLKSKHHLPITDILKNLILWNKALLTLDSTQPDIILVKDIFNKFQKSIINTFRNKESNQFDKKDYQHLATIKKYELISKDSIDEHYNLLDEFISIAHYLQGFVEINQNKNNSEKYGFIPNFLSSVLDAIDPIHTYTETLINLHQHAFKDMNPTVTSNIYRVACGVIFIQSALGRFLFEIAEKDKIKDLETSIIKIFDFIESNIKKENKINLKDIEISIKAGTEFKKFQQKIRSDFDYMEGFHFINRFQNNLKKNTLTESSNTTKTAGDSLKYITNFYDFEKNISGYWQDMSLNGLNNNFYLSIQNYIAISERGNSPLLFASTQVAQFLKSQYYIHAIAHVKKEPSLEIVEQSLNNLMIKPLSKDCSPSINSKIRQIKRATINPKRNNNINNQNETVPESETFELTEYVKVWIEEVAAKKAKKFVKQTRKNERLKNEQDFEQLKSLNLQMHQWRLLQSKSNNTYIPRAKKASNISVDNTYNEYENPSSFAIKIPKAPGNNPWDEKIKQQESKNYLKYRVEIDPVEVPQEIKAFMDKLAANSDRRVRIVGGFIHSLLGGSTHEPRNVDLIFEGTKDDLIAIEPSVKEIITHNHTYYKYGIFHISLLNWRTDLEEDAERRDCVTNAIYCSAEGYLDDPLDGLSILNNPNAMLSIIGNVAERIDADPVLILRMLDLSTKLNRELQHDTKQSMRNQSKKLNSLEFGVIKCHFKKLFLQGSGSINLSKFIELNMLHGLLPLTGPKIKKLWNDNPCFTNYILQQMALSPYIQEPQSIKVARMFSLLLLPATMQNDMGNILELFNNQFKLSGEKLPNTIHFFLFNYLENFKVMTGNNAIENIFEHSKPMLYSYKDSTMPQHVGSENIIELSPVKSRAFRRPTHYS